ncbi:FtsW/RodA/SpoVE family cell cycle protein [uncultured Fibrella sp.]|uniref:FtsW/RodA/SpoVE family cell cycle protein n=1 Tax=uncultured Fibrella sp. TaxID=1284596 RepID=UPI0035CB0654
MKSSPARQSEFRFMLLGSVLLTCLFARLFWTLSGQFDQAMTGYRQGSIVNLAKPLSTGDLRRLLQRTHALTDPADVDLLVSTLSGYLEHHTLPNVGELSRQTISVALTKIDSLGGRSYRVRAAEVRKPDNSQFPGVRPTSVRLFSDSVRERLKADQALTVRTPSQFKSRFILLLFLFFGAFWSASFFWRIRQFTGDPLLLPMLMILTGLSLLTQFSLQDPLRDLILAEKTVYGVVAGLLMLTLLSQMNVAAWYTKRHYDWLYWLRHRTIYNLPGFTWVVLAVGLVVLVVAVGSGPAGSGVNVNLSLPIIGKFQPSELTKFLLVIGLAGYFSVNGEFLQKAPRPAWRLQNLLWVGGLVALVLLLYLIAGDMGPALVICLTFILLYGITRGDLGEAFVTLLAYIALLWLLSSLLNTDANPDVRQTIQWVATGIIALGLTAYSFLKKRIYDTAILLMLVVALFAVGDSLPGVGDRLTQRKSMWLSPWYNLNKGGDHLAHSIWSLASGGLTGQGIGEGFANNMPAAHTDMVLATLGEEIGWLGLVAVILLIGLLLHRSLLIAGRAGQVFSFYICTGIAVATSVQFLLIAGGSFGLIPLTGVSVPFLSYGMSSMCINLAAFGLICSVSARPGAATQSAYISTLFNKTLQVTATGQLIGLVALVGALSWYQVIRPGYYLTRQAIVPDRNGVLFMSYNPRIDVLMARLKSGSIYDRNGLLLATSSPDSVRAQTNTLLDAVETGLTQQRLDTLLASRQARYYPFGADLFFWTGDYNTKLLWGGQNGYCAEHEHLAFLRGFSTAPNGREEIELPGWYKAKRGTPAIDSTYHLKRYDYSQLEPLLKAGPNSNRVAEFNQQSRDVTLSVDAALQMALQTAIRQSDFSEQRTSVVVIDAASGEVLASAVNPLPNLANPRELLLPDSQKRRLDHVVTDRDPGITYPTPPGSTIKLLTALAALNQAGPAAADIRYSVQSAERIRLGPPPEPNGVVDMEKAIVKSSNVYFIRLANNLALDSSMAALYRATGMHLQGTGGYLFSPPAIVSSRTQRIWRDSVFLKNRAFYSTSNPINPKHLSEFSWIAWGQGRLDATPLALARLVGSIANGGVLVQSRFTHQTDTLIRRRIATPEAAALLTRFMRKQSEGNLADNHIVVAGKTGTPARTNYRGRSIFDGWYAFFAPTPSGRSHTVVCIRIEEGDKSANAVALANRQLVPVLIRHGYLGSFPANN